MSNLTDEPAAGTASTVPVRPMDVVALRLVSAWAGLMPDENIRISYDGAPSAHGRLTRAYPDAAPTESQVLIPANTRAKRPRMAAMRIQMGSRSHEQPLENHAAAFWSESAVEKFLVPYLAALGGPRAAAVLSALDAAWNGYDTNRRVFALLLRGQVPVGGSLDVHDLLDVLYLDPDGGKQVAPLSDFQGGGTRAEALGPSPVSLDFRRSAAVPGGVLPTEYQLRVMAEWVSALRTEPGYFVYDTVRGGFGAPVAACPPPAGSDAVVIPVHTGKTRPDRPVPDMITLVPEGVGADAAPVQFPAHQGDAAFWTAGAVSKVMIPYYAMAYGAEALLELAEIHRTWESRATPTQAEAAYADEGVYGLVHLPRSDWGYETASGFVPLIRDTMAAVVARPGGAPRMQPFSELLRRSR
jgi:hypothetical protein